MTIRAIAVLISLVGLAGLIFVLVVSASPAMPPRPDDPWAKVPVWPKPTDHTGFFAGPFPDGPSVTRACVTTS